MIMKKNHNFINIIKIPIKYSPSWSIFLIIIKVLNGIIPTLQILVTSIFIDNAISVANSTSEIKTVIPPILFLTLLISYTWISEKLAKFADIKLEIDLQKKLRSQMIEHRANLYYKYIENSDSWDLITRVCTEPELKVKKGYKISLDFVSLSLKALGILAILLFKIWWVALIILIGSVILFILSFKSGNIIYKSNKDTTKQKRRYMYLDEILSDRKHLEERVLFNFSKSINEKCLSTYEEVRRIILKTEFIELMKIQIGTIITSLISIFIIITLLPSVMTYDLSLGLFISISTSVLSLVKTMSSDLPWYTREISKYIEYLYDLNIFYSFDKDDAATNLPLDNPITFQTIEFRNVKFKYPGTHSYVLNNVSFTIEKGKHYAFLGVNGAGKTTIIKLLTGLYREYEGDILVDGIDIRAFNQSYYKTLCSVIYQDFAKYYISIRDNIIIGNLTESIMTNDNNTLEKIISDLNLTDLINNAPQGIDSYLGKINCQGIDISEGQWQKIAIARVLLKPSNFIILDEPTSSLDPISESAMYERFEKISQGKTTLFISHRLGSTKLADKIFVLSNGEIIEEGNHHQLLAMSGIYSQMYDSQKGWYS